MRNGVKNIRNIIHFDKQVLVPEVKMGQNRSAMWKIISFKRSTLSAGSQEVTVPANCQRSLCAVLQRLLLKLAC